MTVFALVISGLALLVSVFSLGWQIVNYLLTGQRAKVDVMDAKLIVTPTGETMGPVLQITVRAVGRVPVEVTGWSISYPNGQHLISAVVSAQYGGLSDVFLGDDLPQVVEPGRSASFNCPRAAIVNAREKIGLDPARARVAVHFGARRSVKAKKPVGAYLSEVGS